MISNFVEGVHEACRKATSRTVKWGFGSAFFVFKGASRYSRAEISAGRAEETPAAFTKPQLLRSPSLAFRLG